MLGGVLGGAFALPALAGAAAIPCCLTFVRQGYIFSLSYGLATAAIGSLVLRAAQGAGGLLLEAHGWLVAMYGVRLFAFLLWRQVGHPGSGMGKRIAALDKTPRAQRVSLVPSIALFYALLGAPLLWHLQQAPLTGGVATCVSAASGVLAAAGLVIEAVADQQKSMFKIALRQSGAADRLYTGGLYAYLRHANYAGEVLFWAGSFGMGLPALFMPGMPLWARGLRLVCSGLGLAGIVFIMTSATKRLEGKQAEASPSVWPVLRADGELDSYEAYTARTIKLLPGL